MHGTFRHGRVRDLGFGGSRFRAGALTTKTKIRRVKEVRGM